MEGKASTPAAWPAPFTIDPTAGRAWWKSMTDIGSAPVSTSGALHETPGLPVDQLGRGPRAWRGPPPWPISSARPTSRTPKRRATCRRWPSACRRTRRSPRWPELGTQGGEMRMLMASAQGHPHPGRLLLCPPGLLRPRIQAGAGHLRELRRCEEGRIFTFKLREGHKWSDGEPFTSEAFRYLLGRRREQRGADADRRADHPAGRRQAAEGRVPGRADRALFVGEAERRVPAGSWRGLAALHLPARPLPQEVPQEIRRRRPSSRQRSRSPASRSWAALHNRRGQPVPQRQSEAADARPLGAAATSRRRSASSSRAIRTTTASTRRASSCPMPTRWCSIIADSKLIPAKAGAGDADLQARNIRFDNYTFLKAGGGAEAEDLGAPVGRRRAAPSCRSIPTSPATTRCGAALFRDVRCRRALSMAIDRDEINQVIYFGLGLPEQQHGAAVSARSTSRNTARPGRPPTSTRPTAAGRDGPQQARRRQYPPAAERPADDDHRRHRGRKHRRDRRAAAGARFLEEDRRRPVHQAVGARGLPQPRLRRRVRSCRCGPAWTTASPAPT